MHIRNFGHSWFFLLLTYKTYFARHNRLNHAFTTLLKPFVRDTSITADCLKVFVSYSSSIITNSHRFSKNVEKKFANGGYCEQKNFISASIIVYNLKEVNNHFFYEKGFAAGVKQRVQAHNYL